jgi:hypothetical protein
MWWTPVSVRAAHRHSSARIALWRTAYQHARYDCCKWQKHLPDCMRKHWDRWVRADLHRSSCLPQRKSVAFRLHHSNRWSRAAQRAKRQPRTPLFSHCPLQGANHRRAAKSIAPNLPPILAVASCADLRRLLSSIRARENPCLGMSSASKTSHFPLLDLHPSIALSSCQQAQNPRSRRR